MKRDVMEGQQGKRVRKYGDLSSTVGVKNVGRHTLQNGIHFNEICILEGLQPNVTNIYIYIYIVKFG